MAQTQAIARAGRQDPARSFPLTPFYDTPHPLPAAKPGELIRSEVFDEYDLPPGVSAVRFLYHSRSASGDRAAASGVVLFPDRKPPAGGWPVIAWAHPLVGVARSCAPSLERNLERGPFLSMYVDLGYAVVITDYTGLGTSFRNAAADTLSNALDVIHAIPAARQAVPELGPRWIAMGAGEGAWAVIGVAELEPGIEDQNYLGSIALSRLEEARGALWGASSSSYRLPLLLAYGIKTVFPQFRESDILTARALLLYRQLEEGCGKSRALPDSSGAGMLKPDWQSNRFVESYFRRNRLGLVTASRPLLVISSENDPSIAETRKTIARLCRQGDRVEFEHYAQSDPGRLIGDSVRDQIAWIEARFSNGPVANNCPQP